MIRASMTAVPKLALEPRLGRAALPGAAAGTTPWPGSNPGKDTATSRLTDSRAGTGAQRAVTVMRCSRWLEYVRTFCSTTASWHRRSRP